MYRVHSLGYWKYSFVAFLRVLEGAESIYGSFEAVGKVVFEIWQVDIQI